MGNIYALTSGKGGVGKSTVSIGLALAFAKLNNKVLLVDMDEGLRCLDVMFGVNESVVFDFGDIVNGKNFGDSIYLTSQSPNLYLIPAPNEMNVITHEALSIFANKIRSIYDIVIFDFPAGIDFSLYSALPQDTTFLTVALPDPVSIRDASIVSEKLEEMEVPTRLILNCFDYKLTKKKIHKSIDDIIDDASLRLLGIIPRSKELSLLSINHKIKPRGKSMKAFTRIAKRLSGKQVLLPKLKKI
jgi:septum site-determining protein MinD